jgi:hypothetical protein
VLLKREGTIAEQAMEEVAKIAVREIHALATKEMVEATLEDLREICHETAMASLEVVSKVSAKVAVHKVRQGIATCKAAARM